MEYGLQKKNGPSGSRKISAAKEFKMIILAKAKKQTGLYNKYKSLTRKYMQNGKTEIDSH